MDASPAEHQVFISYSSADQAAAQRICEALEAAGMPCWMAPRNIPGGADFPSAIIDAISSSRVMVSLLSAAACSSPHVLSEIGHAFNNKKTIIPVRLTSAALPEDFDYYLAMRQWLDATQGITDDVLKRVLQACRDAIDGKDLPVIGTASRRWIVWATAAALVCLVGAVTYVRSTRSPDGREMRKIVDPAMTDSAAKTPPAVKKTWVNPKDGQTYLWIPPGSFTMGCSPSDDQCADDEKPAHRVDLTQGFWLAQTEVTHEAYRKAGGRNRSPADGDPKLPLRGLSWQEAKAYCATVDGRLPFEAEWEYAARGGTTEPYYGTPSKIAWYENDSQDATHPAGAKDPNSFGLYDMLGNVSEWVLDRYYNRYDLEAPAVGPQVEQPLSGNASAIARGGFWAAELKDVRVSHRSQLAPDEPAETVGVRCASDHR